MKASFRVAINEGVSLLDKLSPTKLTKLRERYPALADDLAPGIEAGVEEDVAPQAALLKEKANVMITALAEASSAAEKALASVSNRVKSARRQRLISQVLVVIGSSSSLATLALSKNRAAVIAAVLTLLAALGNLIAEYNEHLLSPQAGTIYDVFQKLADGAYRARSLSTELTLTLKYQVDMNELKGLVERANMLCEELNGWLIQLLKTVHQ
jgi:hypothetical protein